MIKETFLETQIPRLNLIKASGFETLLYQTWSNLKYNSEKAIYTQHDTTQN